MPLHLLGVRRRRYTALRTFQGCLDKPWPNSPSSDPIFSDGGYGVSAVFPGWWVSPPASSRLLRLQHGLSLRRDAPTGHTKPGELSGLTRRLHASQRCRWGRSCAAATRTAAPAADMCREAPPCPPWNAKSSCSIDHCRLCHRRATRRRRRRRQRRPLSRTTYAPLHRPLPNPFKRER
jgi:hypothetical protein